MTVHGPEALKPVSGEDRAAKRRQLPAGRVLVVFVLNIHTEKAHFVMGFHQVDTHYSLGSGNNVTSPSGPLGPLLFSTTPSLASSTTDGGCLVLNLNKWNRSNLLSLSTVQVCETHPVNVSSCGWCILTAVCRIPPMLDHYGSALMRDLGSFPVWGML